MRRINDRQKAILELISEKDYVGVQDLSDHFGVSVVTIRKDLNLLESRGHVFRIHGGAARQQRYAFEMSVTEKENIFVDEKKSIASAAKKLLEANDFIIMASGTTISYMAKAMDDTKKLTVLTPSIKVALELCKLVNVNVVMIGGELRKSASSVVGAMAETVLKSFSCNKLFLGVDGIDFDFGISTSNASEAYLNQLMINQSEKVIVLVDSSKIGKRGFGHICNLDKIDTIITDNHADEKFVEGLRDVGIEVIVAR